MITTLSAHRRIDPRGAVRGRTLRPLALAVVAALVATFGVVTLAAPAAAAPGPMVTVTDAPAEGGTVTVTGTGFNADPEALGVYVGIGAAGAAGFYTAGTTDTVWVAVTNTESSGEGGRTAPMGADGSFTVELTAPAPGTPQAVYVSRSHGNGNFDKSQDVVVAVEYEAAPPAAPAPALTVDVPSLDAGTGGVIHVTGTGYGSASDNGFYVALVEQGLWAPGTTPTPGTGAMAAFIWLRVKEGAATPLVLDEHGGWTASLAVDAGKLTAGTSYQVITFASHMEPTNRALDAVSGVIAATGSTVDPDPDPDPQDPPSDPVVKVAVRSGTATMTGSGFAEYAARDGLYVSLSRAGLSGIAAAQADSAKVADFWATTSGRYGATLTADGTFTITTDFAPKAGVDYAVYVADVNGHRPIDLLSVPVTVPTGGSDGSGGSGDTGGETPPAPTTGGGSVSGPSTTGVDASSARPGEQLTITAGGFAPHETGIVLELHSDPLVLATGLTADAGGVVSHTFTVPAGTPAGQHTLVLKGATHTAHVPLDVAEPLPVCVARVVSGATVTWGVKADFRSYVTGSVANGTISTSRVSGNGPWTWSGGSGTFNTVDTVGRASFSGGVTFTGHGGVLDVGVSNLRVQVSTPSSGTLIGDLRTGTTNRSGIALATLNLAAGSRSASSTQVSWSGVPATLTSAGAAGFEGFYTAGTAMDAVSFTMPLGAETACTSASGANAGKYLANTGADLDLAGLALLLLLGGGLMVLVARRLPRHATARTPVPEQG